MRTATIPRVADPPAIDPPTDDAGWDAAVRVPIDQFNWGPGGPATTAWFAYDADALYLRVHAEDHAIEAQTADLNGPTYRDSSFELFVDPTPAADSWYFNFEVNCAGVFKLAWQAADPADQSGDRDLIPPRLASTIRVETTVEGVPRDPRPDDEAWWLTAALPVETLAAVTGVPIAPAAGTEWRANCYRSGVPETEKASWNPMPIPEPRYHSPEHFGRFRFD